MRDRVGRRPRRGARRAVERALARARAARRASPSACSRRRASPRRRAARPGSRGARSPSKRWSTGSLAVAAGDDAPPARRARAAARRARAAARPAEPASASASRRFGVTTVASGNSRATSVSTASSWSSRAPELATITGSTTSGTRWLSRKSATVSISARENSIPVFAASTPMSSKTASSCARTNSGGSSCTAVTPSVFCAVSATSTLMPWQPAAAKALRSAWMPAPPPESDVGDRQATRNDMLLPSPA